MQILYESYIEYLRQSSLHLFMKAFDEKDPSEPYIYIYTAQYIDRQGFLVRVISRNRPLLSLAALYY